MILTILNWRKKLIIILACVLLILGLNSLHFVLLSGRLEDDVLNQPEKVQTELEHITKE
ncbi:MAG: hypothetical protein PHI90_03220 [Clostridia bacterium]|nr:hypothetical protein [Clostridia bacterium]MDD4047828.1 hypothetical protein [Clostridia bacterium]